MALALFLGGAHSDIPLLESLKGRGLSVLLLNNAPSEVVNGYADEYLCVDYSNKDAVLEAAVKFSPRYLISGCNDAAYLSCAYVTEQLGIPGYDPYEVALTLHHKDRFRNFMRDSGFSALKYLNLTELSQLSNFDSVRFTFPLIVKPVDRSGGKGISIVETRAEVEAAVSHAFECSFSGNVVIEEFVNGELKSFSAFWVDGQILFSFFDHEFSKYNPYQVSSSLAPLVVDDYIRARIIDDVAAIAAKMRLIDGLIHTQLLLHVDKYHIVEITRRTPGDLYASPVQCLTGIDYTSLTLDGYTGGPLQVDNWRQREGATIRHCPAVNSDGVIREYLIDPEIQQYIIKQIKYLDVGDRVENYKFQRMGVFILFLPDRDKAEDILQRIDELIFIKVL
jgi:biotin carboxylase